MSTDTLPTPPRHRAPGPAAPAARPVIGVDRCRPPSVDLASTLRIDATLRAADRLHPRGGGPIGPETTP